MCNAISISDLASMQGSGVGAGGALDVKVIGLAYELREHPLFWKVMAVPRTYISIHIYNLIAYRASYI